MKMLHDNYIEPARAMAPLKRVRAAHEAMATQSGELTESDAPLVALVHALLDHIPSPDVMCWCVMCESKTVDDSALAIRSMSFDLLFGCTTRDQAESLHAVATDVYKLYPGKFYALRFYVERKPCHILRVIDPSITADQYREHIHHCRRFYP